MISDNVFKSELDAICKRQGMRKKGEREMVIFYALSQPIEERDALLDNAEMAAREAEAKKRKSREVPSEFMEQCDFVAWFRENYPGIVIMSIRNGGKRHPSERCAQLLEGMHPGAADLFIPAWLCWIEMKRIRGGVWSKEQNLFSIYVHSIGQHYLLAMGCQDAINKINEFIVK